MANWNTFAPTKQPLPVEHVDQMGRRIILENKPRRIISVVPSQTELLFHLGLDKEVAGITRYCIHPAHQFTAKQKVGGTKKLNFENIEALAPDLIIGNKEENDKEQVEALAQRYPVWMSDVETLEDALMMIELLGELTGTEEAAYQLCGKVIEGFAQLKAQVAGHDPVRAAYLIWRKPWMGASSGTFIHEMIKQCGMVNVLDGFESTLHNPDSDSLRYPLLALEELKEQNPEVILLSSEPFPFKEKHIEEIKEVLPCAEIRLVDGEMFSWYGSRMLHSPQYFSRLLKSIGVGNGERVSV